VVVTLAVEGSSDTLVIELASWLRSDWMTRSQVWNWSGKTGPDLSVKADLTLRYTDEFLGSPEAFTTEGGSIGVRLTGKPSSKFWRDWIASKLLPDIKRKFPMITGVGGIRDDG